MDNNVPYNELKDIPLFTQVAVIITGIWGAFLNFSKREKGDVSLKLKVWWFLQDAVTSAGVSMLTFFMLIGYGVNEILAVGVSGFTGHMGARFIFIMQLALLERIGAARTFKHLKEKDNDV